MVRVKISKPKLEQMEYFDKVDTQAQDTDVPNRKDLVIGVEEKNTGNVTSAPASARWRAWSALSN